MKKTVIVDLYKLKNFHSGLGQFSHHLHEHLRQSSPEDLDFQYLIPRNFPVAASAQYHRVSWLKRYFPAFNPPADLWHSTQQFPSHRPSPKMPQLLTIHDLNFLREKDDAKAQKYLQRLQKNVNRADYLSTISHFTKGELQKHIDTGNKEIRVIYPGVPPPAEIANHTPAEAPRGKFLFTIGIFSAKKNFHLLVEMMPYLPGFKLVIAGNHQSTYGSKVKELIRKLKLEEVVILAGKISETDKAWYYHNCRALLFPSMAEGFGMPPVEAMHAGKAVFLSKMASLPEIGGPHAFYWDALQPEAMGRYILQKMPTIEKDSDLGKNLQQYAQRFKWKESVEQYLRYYREILYNHP